ncbi:Coiled-coil domain-containing protein 137 [Microtus ochrogaster]|uniref:Coiled-coil domain-containing protein 137 n=1 Tax=Microtus ochrogaster TaxID=79684 RepID=A0A8J6GY10_MICOH|nr:Coiled-coil domain-containing protein 137 [Microtus ochrogaster]
MGGPGRARGARPAGPGGSGQPHSRRRQQQAKGQQRLASRPGQRSKEKKKVNCKPKNQDEQEIPFRLREIMRNRQEMKKQLSNKKRKKEGGEMVTGYLPVTNHSVLCPLSSAQAAFKETLEKEAKGEEDTDIVVPKFKQRKGESEVAYVQRMEQEAQHVLFLSKNQAPRQPEVQAAPKKEKSERKKAFQKRRLEKAQKKREERTVDRLEQELLKDTVEFGEVVLQPPELTVQPRRSIGRDAPGKKSLMLKMLLGAGGGSLTPATSMARQRILGEERERAVQAYRALKKLQRLEVTSAHPLGCSSQRKLQTCL